MKSDNWTELGIDSRIANVLEKLDDLRVFQNEQLDLFSKKAADKNRKGLGVISWQ